MRGAKSYAEMERRMQENSVMTGTLRTLTAVPQHVKSSLTTFVLVSPAPAHFRVFAETG